MQAIMHATIEEERRSAIENSELGFWTIFKGTNGWRLLIAAWPKIAQQVRVTSPFRAWRGSSEISAGWQNLGGSLSLPLDRVSVTDTILQFVGLAVFNTYATYFFQLAGAKDPFCEFSMNLRTKLIVSGHRHPRLRPAHLVYLLCFHDRQVWVSTLMPLWTVGLTNSRRPLTVYGYAVTVAAVLALGIVGFFDYKSPALGALLIFFASIAIFCEFSPVLKLIASDHRSIGDRLRVSCGDSSTAATSSYRWMGSRTFQSVRHHVLILYSSE